MLVGFIHNHAALIQVELVVKLTGQNTPVLYLITLSYERAFVYMNNEYMIWSAQV